MGGAATAFNVTGTSKNFNKKSNVLVHDELTITGVNELVYYIHYVVLPPSSLGNFKFRRSALAPLGFYLVKPAAFCSK